MLPNNRLRSVHRPKCPISKNLDSVTNDISGQVHFAKNLDLDAMIFVVFRTFFLERTIFKTACAVKVTFVF